MTRIGRREARAKLARDAFIWGYPLVQTMLYLRLARERNLGFNQLIGAPGLPAPADKIAGPNMDVLYGLAWLDLTIEPQVLHVPDAQDRYYAVQLIDAYENSFAYVGKRATGTSAGDYAITGPDWQGELPAALRRIEAPTNIVLMLTRTMVADTADLESALAIQAGYGLTPLSAFPEIKNPLQIANNPFGAIPTLQAAKLGVGYFDLLGEGLAAYPPPASDRDFVDRLSAIGIGPGKTPSTGTDAELQEILAAEIVRADDDLHSLFFGNQEINGWRVWYGTAPFIRDPLERAALNVNGVGNNIAEEALYFFCGKGPDGKALDGNHHYALNFPAGGLPPVNACWSLGLYGSGRDGGSWKLEPNAIDRYHISSLMKGLKPGPDGALQIQIQHTPPAIGTANWLPAPAGPFMLMLRTYWPKPELTSGEYKMPQIALL